MELAVNNMVSSVIGGVAVIALIFLWKVAIKKRRIYYEHYFNKIIYPILLGATIFHIGYTSACLQYNINTIGWSAWAFPFVYSLLYILFRFLPIIATSIVHKEIGDDLGDKPNN